MIVVMRVLIILTMLFGVVEYDHCSQTGIPVVLPWLSTYLDVLFDLFQFAKLGGILTEQIQICAWSRSLWLGIFALVLLGWLWIEKRVSLRKRKRQNQLSDSMTAPAASNVARLAAERHHRPAIIGTGATLMFGGGLIAWGMFAPLHSAIIAEGRIQVQSNKKTLDHLDGGIVSELHILEGAAVQKGQLLLRLDTSEIQSRIAVLERRMDILSAQRARLQTEQAGANEIIFPLRLIDRAAGDKSLTSMLKSQNVLFQADRAAITGEEKLNKQRIKQITQQIAGTKVQMESLSERLSIAKAEHKRLKKLYDSRLVKVERLSILKVQMLELSGQISEQRTALAQAHVAIDEVRLKLAQATRHRAAQVAGEMRDTENKILELPPQLSALRQKFARTALRAPVSGTVIGLNKFTIGGAIRPGEAILHIVPKGDTLIVTARFSPTDIDVARSGMRATVRLLAFNTRDVNPVMAKLDRIAPDATKDEVTQRYYFEGIVHLDPTAVYSLSQDQGLSLKPGMPVEVTIPIHARTPLEYLIDPLLTHFRRAMIEE